MKKSKFLKKSLAMLLALMLVVAMIPLSASAAEAPAGVVRYITVGVAGDADSYATVDLQDDAPAYQVRSLSADLSVKLAAELVGNYELQALAAESVDTEEITVTGTTLDADKYFTKTGDKTATISLQLVDTKGTTATSDDTKYDPFVVTLNQVDARTTTNLSEDVVLGRGVYSAEVDNVNKVINVVLARHTGVTWDATDPAWSDADNGNQDGLNAQIQVSGTDGSTVPNNGWVNADQGDTFQVTSESRGNRSTYTIVATYKDAIKSFSVDGVDGVISDEDKNDVPDTITVTLPKDAINDQWGYPVTNPEFAVEYKVEGSVHCTVGIFDQYSQSVDSNIVSGDEVTFNGLALDNAQTEAKENEWNGTVRVYRLGTGNDETYTDDAIQVYNLKVQLEDSTDTDITYARVDDTIADVDLENGTIHAVLPRLKDDGSSTERDNATLVLYTASTTSRVVIDGVDAVESQDPNDQAAGRKVWISNNDPKNENSLTVDLSTQKVITVYAEDGQTTRQYTITTEISGRHDDASITAFAIGDYEGVITNSGGANTPDVITVTVPYMTLDVSNLRVYATASSGAKVQHDTNGDTAGGMMDVINGYHNGAAIGLGAIDVTNGVSTTIVAVDKNDETVRQEYVVNVVLDKPAATGNRLEGLHFTAQPVTNDSDRDIMHAIDEDENVFTANVWENTDSSNNVGTINLQVPPSLLDHTENGPNGGTFENYNNVITDFTTVNGGVAFAVIDGGDDDSIDLDTPTGDVRLKLLDATDSDANNATITGTILNNNAIDSVGNYYYDEINTVVVLPEEIARQVLTDTAPTVYGGVGEDENDGCISEEKVLETGTVYTVSITPQKHSADDDLLTFTVGDTELTVNTSNNTISGVLPWSATNNPDVAVDWEISKYARAFALYGGYGELDQRAPIADADDFYFERNDDHTVTVQYNGEDMTAFEVRAEDRLASTGTSYTDWTFNLTWKDACDDADFESFSINGVNGVIDDSDPDNRTITVNLPFASDVTGLVAEFETSPEATVTLTTPDGVLVESGVTSINYTNTVLLYVHSESGENVNSYKVTVNLGSHFSDIDEDDWYYDNVMDAADNGYISGMGDGTFNPMGSTTRAQFASMIANAMGYEADPEAPSMFRDVADDFWGKAAINFCVQNGILTGYEDGSFQPNKAITRQEAASILRNAFELTETTSELFPDDSAIAGWAKESVYLVKASGLMKGDAGTGNFRPTSTITRAEAASILMNAKYAGVIN
ncbi:MAG: S-layer homology domain-containing protein [Acutalibacter sp.]